MSSSIPPSPCENCKAVGELAEKTMDTYYPEDMAAGKVAFIKANYFDPHSRTL